MEYFRALGMDIEKCWHSRGYDEALFPEIATRALRSSTPIDHVEVQDILDWVFGEKASLYPQPEMQPFGQPPIELFRTERFYIEALFWFTSTTSIHQHAFAGAFSVLAGSSVHSEWRFDLNQQINVNLRKGRLYRKSTEILRPGDVRRIVPGDEYIHQLFHLEAPSVTVVVRTFRDESHLPQYAYKPPGLAVHAFRVNPLLDRRLSLLEAMIDQGDLGNLENHARRLLLEEDDLETVFRVVSLFVENSKVDADFFRRCVTLVRRRHGEFGELLIRVAEHEHRTRLITSCRQSIKHPEHRFLLALLMLMPDRDSVLEGIDLYTSSSDSVDQLMTWVTAMSSSTVTGIDMQDELNVLLFRALVDGVDTRELEERLEATYGKEQVRENRAELWDHLSRMARSEIFHPLFQGSPLRLEQPIHDRHEVKN